MSKTSHRKIQPPTPSAIQLTAVRRLAQSGDRAQAQQRLAVLRKSFPDFKPLLGLAWEVEDACGVPMLAAARAVAWQRASPQSRAANEALCSSARAAGLVAVYGRALQRLTAMDGAGVYALPESINSPFGTLSHEQAEALDLSRMHLADENPTAAMAVLQGLDHPSARNNLALAAFVGGDVAQAAAVIEANWRAEPDNLFALNSLVRWRCWIQGLDACLGFAAPLRHTTPRRAEDAVAQISALRFLGEDSAALLAWNNAEKAPYWPDVDDELRAMFSNLQRADVALAGGSNMWFPGPWLRALSSIANLPENQWEPRWDAVIETCDAHVDYLYRVATLGDPAARKLGQSVLKLRAKRADTAALARLQALLTHPAGPDSGRMELCSWLESEGLRNSGEPVSMWQAGALRMINPHGFRISNEPKASPFPPPGTRLNERFHEAIGLGKLPKALDLALQLRQMYPQEPSALINLAAIKEGLRHPADGITALYRQAFSMAPDYLFARCGWARCLTREGKISEAKSLLEGILDREEFHRSEYQSILLTQRELALALGEHEIARNLDQAITDLRKAMEF